MLVVVLAACGPASATSGQVSTTFDGNKKLVLSAGYTSNAQSSGISVWADVPVGTHGVVETAGPLHMRCEGKFVPQNDNQANPDNLPVLDLGGGAGIAFAAPIGHYVVVATIPSKGATIQQTFEAGSSYADPITGVYDLSLDCVPVADTIAELNALLPRHVMAVQTWIMRMNDPVHQAQLLPLAQRASLALPSGDTAKALDALTQIKEIITPLSPQGPYYPILVDVLASIALLSQPVPPS
jgi:hypothetical protein